MYDRILVPVDGSDPADHAADEAIELARRMNATLDVLYVVDTTAFAADAHAGKAVEQLHEHGRRAVDDVVDRAERHDVTATGSVREGVPHRTILDAAAENGDDAIVMGTHGRTGLEHVLLGSVTENVVRHAEIPVLTVRHATETE